MSRVTVSRLDFVQAEVDARRVLCSPQGILQVGFRELCERLHLCAG